MNGYTIAYIIIGVLLFLFLLGFMSVLIIPHTKLYKDKESQTVVKIAVDKDGNQEVYLNGVKQELAEGQEQVDIPANRDFDPSKDVK
jgi:hypothetical protein